MLGRLGFGSVDACADRLDFQALLRQVRPHLVVVDPDGLEGVEDQVAAARETLPHLTVVVASARPGTAAAIDALVSKQWEADEIERTLHELIRERLDWAAMLSARELEILRLVADGAANRTVAAALWLSDQTVKFHLANAYRKLGVSSRHEAVERLRESGLLADGSTTSTVDPSPAVRTAVPGHHDT
jgi:DNA-binding CsgD family transcriptional regulator